MSIHWLRAFSHGNARHAHTRDAHSGRLSEVWHRIRSFWDFLSALLSRSTLLELRSLPRRIQFLRQNNLDHVLLFGRMFEVGPPQYLRANKRTSARIADTRSLEENLPWVTVVDRFLFLEGWTRGYEYGSNVPVLASVPGCNTQLEQTLSFDSTPAQESDTSSVHRPTGQG